MNYTRAAREEACGVPEVCLAAGDPEDGTAPPPARRALRRLRQAPSRRRAPRPVAARALWVRTALARSRGVAGIDKASASTVDGVCLGLSVLNLLESVVVRM